MRVPSKLVNSQDLVPWSAGVGAHSSPLCPRPCRLCCASAAQCSEYELLDWRRFRRPLPGANPRAFEPPQQPLALLVAQQAARAQRAAIASRIDRLQLMRLHQEREQHQVQQELQRQQSTKPQQLQQQQGPLDGAGSLPLLSDPYSRGGVPQSEAQPIMQQQDRWQQRQGQQQLEGQLGSAAAAALQHPHQQWQKRSAASEAYPTDHGGANGTHSNGGHAAAYAPQQSFDGQRAVG